MSEKVDETAEGYYVRSGDVLEWRWKKGHEPETPEPAPAPRKTAAKRKTRKR